MRFFVCLCVAAVASGCAVRHPAPVIERASGAVPAAKPTTRPAPAPAAVRAPEALPEFYTVKRGETLYGIALDHGLEYREIAEWNQITDPNQIRAGQVLRMRAPAQAQAVVTEGAAQVRPVTSAGKVESRPLEASVQSIPPASAPAPRPPVAASGSVKTEPRAYKLPFSAENVALMSRGEAIRSEPRPEPKSEIKPEQKQPVLKPEPQSDGEEKVDWGWPTAGRVIAKFSPASNKGVDIGAQPGEAVLAAASGKVTYVGSGIPSLGRLIVVQHNKAYLSVYGHNDRVMVKLDQKVLKGQKIGEVGNPNADSPKLHFQIRRFGTPLDPLKFLPERPS